MNEKELPDDPHKHVGQVLIECRVIEVFVGGITQRVETIGEHESLRKYVSPGAMRAFFIPMRKMVV